MQLDCLQTIAANITKVINWRLLDRPLLSNKEQELVGIIGSVRNVDHRGNLFVIVDAKQVDDRNSLS